MAFFQTSPEKRLEQAQKALREARHFEAWKSFDRVAEDAKASPSTRDAARQGARLAREQMIATRLEEAEQLRSAGELEQARDRVQTALDLAGEDLDRAEIDRLLRVLDSPKRTLSPTAHIEEDLPDDLLEAPETTLPLPPPSHEPSRPRARTRGDEAAVTPLDELEASLLEIHLETLAADLREHYRGLGAGFHRAWLALVEGTPNQAAERFADLPASLRADPWVALEEAHALLLASRPAEALRVLDESPAAGPTLRALGAGADARAGDAPSHADAALGSVFSAGGPNVARRTDDDFTSSYEVRRLYLRIETQRALGRHDEAVAGARALASGLLRGSIAAESLLAWTLIESGQTEEAYRRMLDLLRADQAALYEEVLLPAAQAASLLGRRAEAVRLLEGLIQARFHRSLQRETEVDFPVQAARQLLELYLEQDPPSERDVHGLVQHLLEHDPAEGERYRDLLLKMAAGRPLR